VIERVDSYRLLAEFLLGEIALTLGGDRQYLVDTRLAPLVKAFGFGSIDGLIRHLVEARPEPLVQAVIDAMVTGETSFFRDAPVFDLLRTQVIPRLWECQHGQRLRIWSGAAASGQEAYSLAMLLLDRFPSLARSTTILASDVSMRLIHRTRLGWYSALEVQRGLNPRLLDRFFTPLGEGYQVKPALRALVNARQLNLVKPWDYLGSFDIVLLRNVLVYFPLEVRAEVLARLAAHLHPGAVLVLGTSEAIADPGHRFERIVPSEPRVLRFVG
jgi:chemotaxis protein methyltransferase CheR